MIWEIGLDKLSQSLDDLVKKTKRPIIGQEEISSDLLKICQEFGVFGGVSQFAARYREIYSYLTETSKLKLWDKLFSQSKSYQPIIHLLDPLLNDSIETDFKDLINEKIKEHEIKEEVTTFLFSKFLSQYFDPNSSIQKLIPFVKIGFEEILVEHEIAGYPKGNFKELSTYNVIIGRNNQIKTRTLKILYQIVNILQKGNYVGYTQPPLDEDKILLRFNQYKDRDLSKFMKPGFDIKLKIIHNHKVYGTMKYWGWEFKAREKETINLHLKIRRDFITIEGHDSSLEPRKIINLIKKNIRPIYFHERSTILDPEGFPEGGWNNYQIEDSKREFEDKFRSIVYFIMDYRLPKILELSRFDKILQGDSLLILFEHIYLIRVLMSIFKFENTAFQTLNEIYRDLYEIDLKFDNQEVVLLAKQIIKEFGFEFYLDFDRGEGKIKFDIKQKDNLNEISEQGHGIRKVLLLILSSIFMNFIFIDEIENGLHPGLQEMISKYLLALKDVQKFLVTHSTSVIPLDNSTRVYTIENNAIIPRTVFLDTYGDRNLVYRQFDHIRALTGSSLESLLFKSAIIFVEGRDDNRFYFNQLNQLKPNYGIERMLDVGTFKKKWKKYLKPIAKFDQRAYFIFDGDYFNIKIVQPDNKYCFVLPCYSYENLIFDPKFLSDVLKKPQHEIQSTILDLIEEKKQLTLDNLFLADLFDQKPPGHITSFIGTNPIDWENSDAESVFILFKNTNKKRKRDKLEIIINQKTTKIDVDSLIRNGQIDLEDETICNILQISKLNKASVIKSFDKVRELANDWDNCGIKYVRLKDDHKTLLRSITNDEMSIKDLRKEFVNYLHSALLNNEQPKGIILKDYWKILQALKVN